MQKIAAGTLAACAAAAPHAQESPAAGEINLEAVTIVGTRKSPAAAARKALSKIPGTASVVDNSEVEKGRASNLEDVLAYQPGVLAVATGGSSANLVSIRGSGINTFYGGYARGIRYLIDGSPISGPGGAQETLLTPNGVNYTEILNGTNAFTYGALAIGGAINYVTHTGRTSPGGLVELEGGSYGYVKAKASYGGVSSDGNTDYYVSALHSQRSGYQEAAPVRGIGDLVVNVGHNINSRLKARFLFRYGQENYGNGGLLTLKQIHDDPQRAAPGAYGRWSYSTLAVGKLEYTIDDDSRLEFALGLNRFNLENSRGTATWSVWPSLYVSPQIRYFRKNDSLFGLKSDTTVIFDATQLDGETRGGNRVPAGSSNQVYYYKTDYSGSRDAAIGVSNALHLNEDTTLTTGVSAVEVKRSLDARGGRIPNTSGQPDQIEYDKWYAVPRLGLSWQATPELQLFSGLGRSIDPPVTWGFPLVDVRAVPGPHFRYNVDPQRGTTWELGLRANTETLNGSLAFYRTSLKDELHSLVVDATTVPVTTGTKNASPTIHQGIEAALDARLWKGQDGDTVRLKQAFTFNDFFFRHDADLGKNELPGLSRVIYQAELEWKNPAGLYAGVNYRYASSYYIDYANTLEVPSYGLWGLSVGYEAPDKKWKAYLDLRNLTDEHYVAAGSARYDARLTNKALFWPGDGRSIFAGVGYRF